MIMSQNRAGEGDDTCSLLGDAARKDIFQDSADMAEKDATATDPGKQDEDGGACRAM